MTNQNTHKNASGFTLIELLVVIAIIGILAAIVLVSLSSARQKGADAGVENQLDSLRTNMEAIANDNSNSYSTACATAADQLTGAANPTGATVQATYGAVEGATEVYCYGTSDAWMVQAPLTTPGTYWCVDNEGDDKAESAVVGTADTVACAP